MVRQSATAMHLTVSDIETAYIDTIKLEQGKGGRKAARELAMTQLKCILHIQFTLELTTQLIAPVIEITREEQR